jgi:hypothetical protein
MDNEFQNNFNNTNNSDDNSNGYGNRSGGQMLAEIARLLLVLLGKFGKWLWKYFKIFLRWLLKMFCKFVLWIIDKTEEGIVRLRAFWNDNDTQAKVRIIRLKLRRAAKKCGVWSIIALKATGRALKWTAIHLYIGFVWLVRKTIEACIHLRPTIKKAWKGICIAAKWLANLMVSFVHGIANWFRARRDAYRRFRKNKGFKGLLIDVGNGLKRTVDNYMEEPQNEENENTDEPDSADDNQEIVTDADLLEAELNEESKVRSFGKRIYDAMKRIVEVD